MTPQKSDFRIVAHGTQSLVATRSFAAPLELVRRAHLDEKLVMQWMSDPQFPLASCTIDARVGGGFTYVWQSTDDNPMSVHGKFLELSPTRIIHTELFSPDWTGGEARVVTDFTAAGNRTEMRVEVTYTSPAAREAVVETGMYDGWDRCLDRLEALL